MLTAERERIAKLEKDLELLKLKQQEQELKHKVDSEKYWTEHKKLRSTVADVKGTVEKTEKFVRTKVSPAILGGIRMAYEEYKKKPKLEEKKLY